MKGTTEQIKQAKEIKSEIETGFNELNPHPIMDKATAYIMDINDANFWIDEAKHHVTNPIGLVMVFARQGLRIKGVGFGDIAKIDETTGEITKDCL